MDKTDSLTTKFQSLSPIVIFRETNCCKYWNEGYWKEVILGREYGGGGGYVPDNDSKFSILCTQKTRLWMLNWV